LMSAFLIPYLLLSGRNRLRRITINSLIVAVVAGSVSAYWFVPFSLELGWAHFLKENAIEYLFRFFSVKPQDFLMHTSAWSYYQGIAFYAGLVGLVLLFRKRRDRAVLSACSLLSALILILLSFGYYGPAPYLNTLPVLDRIPPYRFLDAIPIISSIGVASLATILLGIRRLPKRASITLVVLILLVSVAEIGTQGSSLEAEAFPKGYASVLTYITLFFCNSRIFFSKFCHTKHCYIDIILI
jgi:hypothetical protein